MSRTVVVRYETRPDAAEENQRLVEKVFAELAHEDPGGLRYATLRLDDGVTFIHVAIVDDGADPLSQIIAFTEFQQGIGDRATGPPMLSGGTLVGSYRALV